MEVKKKIQAFKLHSNGGEECVAVEKESGSPVFSLLSIVCVYICNCAEIGMDKKSGVGQPRLAKRKQERPKGGRWARYVQARRR